MYNNDLYSVGYDFTGEEYRSEHSIVSSKKSVIKYWKNSREFAVTDGSKNAYPRDIYISNGDIYILGDEEYSYNDITGQQQSCSKYWKDGEGFVINESYRNSAPLKIHGKNDSISVISQYRDDLLVWENENQEIVEINLDLPDSWIQSLVIDHNHIYTLANSGNYSTKNKILHWYKGAESYLSDNEKKYKINSIFIDKNDIYTIGSLTEFFVMTFHSKTIYSGVDFMYYSKNDMLIINENNEASLDVNYSTGSDIFRYKNDIYTAGTENELGKYQKNGVSFDIPIKTDQKILIHNNDTYILGKNNNQIILMKNNKANTLVDNVGAWNGRIYIEDNEVIVTLTLYNLYRKSYETMIYKGGSLIRHTRSSSANYHTIDVLFKKGKIYTYGIARDGNFYYSINNQYYQLSNINPKYQFSDNVDVDISFSQIMEKYNYSFSLMQKMYDLPKRIRKHVKYLLNDH
jgi:hypothetical protein